MSDKKTILILIAIVSAVIILIGILIGIYSTPSKQSGNNEPVEQNKLYFVTQSPEGTQPMYGICKTDGTTVLKTEYTKMARVEDSVYLKNAEDSYLFFLSDGKSVSLGGKESEIYFVYDKEGKLLPYYILRYGDSEQASIYRIYNNKGVRHDTRDFSSLNDAYKFLNAKEVFKAITAPTNITDKYTVVTTVQYPTSEGKSQYIVTNKSEKAGLQGLVDESGRIILELTYEKVSTIQNSNNAVKAEKEGKTFIFLDSEKLIEVESGFEFTTSNGYFIQRRANIVNKIYNLSGDVVVDGIYNLTEDLTSLNYTTGTAYMLVQEKKGIYSLYNITSNKKSETEYSGVLLDYMDAYKYGVKNTAFVCSNNNAYYAVDLENLKSYKMNITTKIYSPLDMGFIYGTK